MAFDLTLYTGLVAQNQSVLGNQQALYFSFDTEGSGALERSFESDRLIQKSGPLRNGL